MNYKAMAAAIRKERFGMWDDIGRPIPLPPMIKGRQQPVTSVLAWPFAYVPWSDQWFQREWIESTKRIYLGQVSARDRTRDYYQQELNDFITNGLKAQMA